MYLASLILGGIIAIFIVSKIVGVILFRKSTSPYKEILSIRIKPQPLLKWWLFN